MARQTRNSYKRKVILFGLLIFVSIALISTGFAAWYISASTSEQQDGQITMGTVSDGRLKIEGLAITSPRDALISFEPKKDDTKELGGPSNLIYGDGVEYENLKVTVSGKVTPVANVDKVTIYFIVPESVKAAATENYIVLPECATLKAGETLTSANGAATAGKVVSIDEEGNFSLDVEITWGSVFGGKNPASHYNNPATLDQAIKEIEDFRAVLYGYMNLIEEAVAAADTNGAETDDTPEILAAKEAARRGVITAHEGASPLAFQMLVVATSK